MNLDKAANVLVSKSYGNRLQEWQAILPEISLFNRAKNYLYRIGITQFHPLSKYLRTAGEHRIEAAKFDLLDLLHSKLTILLLDESEFSQKPGKNNDITIFLHELTKLLVKNPQQRAIFMVGPQETYVHQFITNYWAHMKEGLNL